MRDSTQLLDSDWFFAFAFPSQKSSLQKFSDLYFLNLLHAREARGNPIPPYAALRSTKLTMNRAALLRARLRAGTARLSGGGEMPTPSILEPLLYSARTYFARHAND